MHAKQNMIEAAISTRIRNQKSLSHSYWKNIKRKVKQKVLISQVVQNHQDHPQGARIKIGIGKGRGSMQQPRILLLGRQCQCHRCLHLLIIIHIDHAACMIQGHPINTILNHLVKILHLQ
jgi:hypothetical protein